MMGEKMTEMTPAAKTKFECLVGELSPENLTCDGELPATAVKKKYAALMKEWRALEKLVGRTVTQAEVWDWIIAEQKTRRNGVN
jgi:hypothetical protein